MAEIRVLERTDADAAADLLARAFRDNPGMTYILGRDPSYRERALSTFLRRLALLYIDYGECWLALSGGAPGAVLLTLPPGAYPLPLRADVALMWTALCHGGPGIARRFAKVDATLRTVHARIPGGAHHYVFMLGADPGLQGHGLGSALLRHFGDHVAGVGCYLETDLYRNVRLFERCGYAVVHRQEIALSGHPFSIWCMQR